ncbi:M18 family aminopeptidase [Varibaculum prostatecancerukia]|uniref:M18 family aminopeptidase n=1 Tax=Varibaculum prostatecancerukia TaxID=2811781 RepID=UPI001C00165E|nr:M18 family aminopeptidase [Varibaculum prostatecancerukia]
MTSFDLETYTQGLTDFITASPCAAFTAHTLSEIYSSQGFKPVDPSQPWPQKPGRYFLRRKGALIAWIVPAGSPKGFRIIGSHTDSPAFKLKPTPDSLSPDGWGQLNVEVYGGMLPNSWLNRELGIAGVVYDRSGRCHLVRTGAIATIPQLAPHLDRESANKLELDRQQHLHPLWYVGSSQRRILEVIAEQAGLNGAGEISSHELYTFDTHEPQRLGTNREFLASARQDNLLSVYSATQALLSLAEKDFQGENILVSAAFDHEEVGSHTETGVAGPLLEQVLRRCALTENKPDAFERMLAESSCLSADVAHSVNPNYPEKHDPDTRPMMGAGPVLKLNASQRYATDAQGWHIWEDAARRCGVKTQCFVSNNAVTCGSTIAPMTATRLGITTIDVGVPILSMHSAREICALGDQVEIAKIMQSYLQK